MRIFRCLKGFTAAMPILLVPMFFMNTLFYVGNEKWRLVVSVLLLFLPPFFILEFLLLKRLPQIKLLRIVILSGLLLIAEIAFYHLPANISQFYYWGGAVSKFVFVLFIIPAGIISDGMVRHRKPLVIVQKEI